MKDKIFTGSYNDTWYDKIARKTRHETGTVKIKEFDLDGRTYWSVTWYNSHGIWENSAQALKTDKAFDRIRHIGGV